MFQANPLEVSETGIVLPMLESLQSQLTAAQKLFVLRAHGDETVSAEVVEQLVHAETHLRKRFLNTPVPQPICEVSLTIPWMAASPSEGRQKVAKWRISLSHVSNQGQIPV